LLRPWLTLAIDVASRMAAGFYLSLEYPSSTSVALAIRHMALPKTSWLAERNAVGDWPVHGLPTAIHIDNAREFRGKALAWGASRARHQSHPWTGCSPTLRWLHLAAYRHDDGRRSLSARLNVE
jgi:transposase InsO family protein